MSNTTAPQNFPKPDLGRIGLWSGSLDGVPGSKVRDVVQEIEGLGFGTYWYPETVGREAFVNATMILGASSKLKAATGIASMRTLVDTSDPVTCSSMAVQKPP